MGHREQRQAGGGKRSLPECDFLAAGATPSERLAGQAADGRRCGGADGEGEDELEAYMRQVNAEAEAAKRCAVSSGARMPPLCPYAPSPEVRRAEGR